MNSGEVKFDFITSDPASNLKPGKSLQVRSRCMQGKNKRASSRRTEREKSKAAKETAVIAASDRTPIILAIPSPRPLINNFVPIRFAGRGIDSEAEALLFKALVYNCFDENVTPLDRCVTLDCLESPSFVWLFSDTAFLHSVLCARYAINDFVSPQWDGTPGRETMFHLRETLSILRVKIQDEYVYQDESVLRVIINLTLLAVVYGDRIAAAAHFEGLYRIVHLRGNTAFLGARPILHFKLDRIDLAWSLSSGRRPYFAQPVKSWACTIAAPYKPLPSHLYRPPRDWDYRLVNVFQDFQNLTLKINRNRLKFVIHDPAIFQNDLTSLQSRLIFLADIAAKPIEQLVRLAMLSMMTTTFRIPGRRVPYNWVVEQLRETYITASSDKTQDKSLLLWVLIKASITVAQTHDAWIRDAWMMVGAGLGWADVRTHLLRVMWIEIAHDELGGMAYRQLEMSKFS